MNDKFGHIKTQVGILAKSIGAPANLLPTYGMSGDAHPNVELSDTGILSYEIYERGQQVRMEYALDVDHLLYLIFRDVTYSMAVDFASKHSDPTVDNRRIEFDYQLELLGRLNTNWQQKEKENQEATSMQFPFKDYQGQRQSYLRELLASGFLYNEAIEKVNQKYP
jgi:hypothetical protein